MKLPVNRNTVYLTLAALLVVTLLYFGETQKNPLVPQKEPTERFPYAFAENARTSHYSKEGELDYTFEAELLEYYRQKNEDETIEEYTIVTLPKVVIYMEDQPWYIDAKEGLYNEHENKLILWNDVIVKQSGQAGKDTQLMTQRLEIYPVEKLAETREPVKITSPLGEIEAVGMRADLAQGKIKLLSKVRGKHVPI